MRMCCVIPWTASTDSGHDCVCVCGVHASVLCVCPLHMVVHALCDTSDVYMAFTNLVLVMGVCGPPLHGQ